MVWGDGRLTTAAVQEAAWGGDFLLGFSCCAGFGWVGNQLQSESAIEFPGWIYVSAK